MFVLTGAVASIVVVRSRLHMAEMAVLVIYGFLFFVFPYKFPWYFLPAIALLAPGPRTGTNRVLLKLSLGFAALSMLGYVTLVRL